MDFIFSRLKRLFIRKQTKNRIPVIDGIKAFAISAVVFFHIFWVLGNYMTVENLDKILLSPGMPILLNFNGIIDMFFLIAAFLGTAKVVNLYQSGKFNYGYYVLERLIRFIPLLSLVLIVYIVAGLPNPLNCWTNLLYLNIFLDFNQQCMNWSWYLSVQEQFMLFLAPPIAFFLYKFPRTAWWIIGILGLYAVYHFRMQAIQQYQFTMPAPYHILYGKESFGDFFTGIYTLPHTRMAPLIVGCILGWAYVRTNFFKFVGKIRLWWTLPGLILSALIIVPSFVLISPHHGIWEVEAGQMNLALTRHSTTLMFAVIFILLVSGNSVLKPLEKFFSMKIWYPFSELSLLIYFYHLIVIEVLYRIVVPENPLFIELMLYFIIAYLISFILSAVTNILLERILRDWGYKIAKRKEERVFVP
ncbi:MAG: acyltransferase family protein [Spirochaetia bacterium]|nr:acyltransferase family protein [Spirochaetia bacterium]